MQPRQTTNSSLPYLTATAAAGATTVFLVGSRVLEEAMQGPNLILSYVAFIATSAAIGFIIGKKVAHCLAYATSEEYAVGLEEKLENLAQNDFLIDKINEIIASPTLLTEAEVTELKLCIDTKLPIEKAMQANEKLMIHLSYLKTVPDLAKLENPITLTNKTSHTEVTCDAPVLLRQLESSVEEKICIGEEELDVNNYAFSRYPRKIRTYLQEARELLGFFRARLPENVAVVSLSIPEAPRMENSV